MHFGEDCVHNGLDILIILLATLHHSEINRLLMLAGRITYMKGRVGPGPENTDTWPTLPLVA